MIKPDWFLNIRRDLHSGFPKSRELRIRLQQMTLGLVLCFSLALGGTINFIVYRADASSWQGKQAEATRNAVLTVSAFLKRAEDSLSLINLLDPDILNTKPEIIRDLLLQNESLLEVIRLDAGGHVIANVFQGNEPVLGNLFTIPQSRWFVQSKAGKPYYGRVQISASDQPYVLMSLPAPEGGVVAARLSMDVLRSVVEDIRFGETGQSFIVSNNGDIISHTQSQLILENFTLSGNPVFTAVLNSPENKWFGEYSNIQGVKVTGTTLQVPGRDWIIFTEVTKEESYSSSRTTLLALMMGILILAVVVIWGTSRFLNSLILHPISLLRKGAERIGEGDLTYRIGMTSGNEIGLVAVAFDRMADQLHERVQEVAERSKELEDEIDVRKKAEKDLLQTQEELEMRVEERTEDLRYANNLLLENNQKIGASLCEKEVMLKEIHHRVKNNLQVVSSLLNLQSQTLKDPGAQTALRDSQMRVRSMALVHERLYQSENLDNISIKPYIESLSEDLFRTYSQDKGRIKLVTLVDDVSVGINDAVPLGLILNELISNSLKHAFPDGRKGEIGVQLQKVNSEQALLRYYDTGKGFLDAVNIQKSKSLGMRLVHNLARQLNTEIEFVNHSGVEIKFLIPICCDGASSANPESEKKGSGD